VSVYNSGSKGE